MMKSFRNSVLLKDPLTETFNRKALEKNLRDLKGKVIIFIDVDDFKKINDTYGHMVGDRILKELAKIIKESLRSSFMGGTTLLCEIAGISRSAYYRAINRKDG